MTLHHILASYPKLAKENERRIATLIGSIHASSPFGAYIKVLDLLKDASLGKDIVDGRSQKMYDYIKLKNGVILHICTRPAESLNYWLENAVAFKRPRRKRKKKSR